MADPADTQRLIGDIAREGEVTSVDHAAATCRVRIADDLETGDLPWLAPRAGTTRIWAPPSIGEQVLVLCPEADTARGIVIGGLFCDAAPAPASDDRFRIDMPDGAVFAYDHQAHRLSITLPAGGTLAVVADGGTSFTGPVAIDGPVTVAGTVDATGIVTSQADVVGGGKSLKSHRHTGVQAGGAISGPPQ